MIASVPAAGVEGEGLVWGGLQHRVVDAHFNATSRSRVVERKANSTPPMTLCSFFVVSIFGNPHPEIPRYTLATFVCLLSLMIAEFTAEMVVE